MNRAESKYFATAVRMDEALLELLEKKDLAYITVKEICEKAGVNRSTFYLHYETLDDLLTESVRYIIDRFVAFMPQDTPSFIRKIETCPLEELYLITPEYLLPYLRYVKEHRRVFRVSLERASALRLERAYHGLYRHILEPILNRYQVPPEERKYMMSFFMNGLMAIVGEWLKEDCADSEEHLMTVIRRCIRQRE